MEETSETQPELGGGRQDLSGLLAWGGWGQAEEATVAKKTGGTIPSIRQETALPVCILASLVIDYLQPPKNARV